MRNPLKILFTKFVNLAVRLRNFSRLKTSKKELKKYRDRFKGERCFIIGNGPSLTVADLEKLKSKKIKCFATHKIFHIYEKTDWRPNFYCAQDAILIDEENEFISQMDVIDDKFIGLMHRRKYKGLPKAIYIKMLLENFYPSLPSFSDDMCKGEYEGFTVTYMCLQLAMYMGFTEIYLLGVDHAYSIEMNPDGTIKQDISLKDHFSDKDVITNIPQTYKSTLAYYSAEKHAKTHGVKIFNATRGGKLAAHERVNFDSLAFLK